MKNICLIRTGHLGDVILTEPIARHFKSKYDNVFLATNYIQTKFLLGNTYTDFLEYDKLDSCGVEFETKINLVYELTPKLNYIEGYANSAGIILTDKIPIVNSKWKNIIENDYVLLAPNTSDWITSMRNWGESNFRDLKSRIESHFKIQVILLDDRYSFTEMLSLIRHCILFVGNDSAPAIIAQCFNKKSFVIFGATHPKYVLFNDNTKAIFGKIDCIGCKNISRNTKIICASPFCLTDLSTSTVYSIIAISLNNLQMEQKCKNLI